jgi:hypothetical protein
VHLGDVKLISGLCAAVFAILAIVITALIIPKDIFMIDELWGFVIQRYQVIVCGGLIVCFPAYHSAKFFCCRRCLGPPEKAKEEPKVRQCGWEYVIG